MSTQPAPLQFALLFVHQSTRPTERGTYLLYNQCDGFHLVEAHFDEGRFLGFYDWNGTTPFGEDCYVAWAKLPSGVQVLYPHFADKPRDGMSAREVTLQRLAEARQ